MRNRDGRKYYVRRLERQLYIQSFPVKYKAEVIPPYTNFQEYVLELARGEERVTAEEKQSKKKHMQGKG